MLSLDQVRLLENRVEKAVVKIRMLESENDTLRGQVTAFQARIGELEGLVHAFKDDQGRIEEGILNALDRLSAFEDSVFTETAPAALDSDNSHSFIQDSNTDDYVADDEVMPTENTINTNEQEEAGLGFEEPESNGQMDIF